MVGVKFNEWWETCAAHADNAGVPNHFSNFIWRKIFVIVNLMLSWASLIFAICFYNNAQWFQARRVLNMMIGNGDHCARAGSMHWRTYYVGWFCDQLPLLKLYHLQRQNISSQIALFLSCQSRCHAMLIAYIVFPACWIFTIIMKENIWKSPGKYSGCC